MKKKLFITFYIFFYYLISAQTDTLHSELDLVTISANKHETPLFRTASSVSIISSEEIALKQSTSVVELLRDVPGIVVSQQGGPGKLSSVFMRGANSNYVLVMIDNVEINDPSSINNAFDFSSLQVSDIEKIEIVKGPQSTLYGSEAAAGIINILTKSGSGKPSFLFRGEAGSNNYYQGNITAKGNISGINYLTNLSRLQTDAISVIKGKGFEKDGYTNNSGFLKIGYDFNERFSANFSYKYIGSDVDLDQAMKNGDDPNFRSNTENHLFNLNLEGNIIDDIWKSSFRGSLFKNEIATLDKIDELNPNNSSKSNYNGDRLSFNWQNNISLIENNLITLGIDSKNEISSSNYHSENMFGPFDSNFPEKKIKTTGLYIQDFITYSGFSATIGYRFDKNEKYGTVSTYRIAPMYFINLTMTKLKSTYGTGFKAPSLYNLFAPFYGNEHLKPEKSIGWDIGFEQFLFNKKISLEVTYFDMKFEDMIGFNESFQSINISKAETNGIEAILHIKELHGFSLAANYTYNKTNDISTKKLSTEQLIRRPKNQLSVSVQHHYDNLDMGLLISHSGQKFDNDFSTFPSSRVSLDSYTIVNLTTSYKLTNNFKVFGRIENLFDADYVEILYYGNLGRSAYFGFELNL